MGRENGKEDGDSISCETQIAFFDRKINEGERKMYIKELHYINVGPIDRADVTLLTDGETTPKPVVFVGKNGSGKSMLLSNIVDMFYEIAQLKYGNAVHYRDEGGYYYYKIITPNLINLGKEEMFSHIKFTEGTSDYEYIYRSSELNKNEYIEKYGIPVAEDFPWGENKPCKKVSIPKEKVQEVFDNEIACYFGPSRFLTPDWLGIQYSRQMNEKTFSVRTYFDGQMKNPIEPENNTEKLQQWLFDVLTDAKPEVIKKEDGNGYQMTFPLNNEVLDLLMIAKDNAEKVVSEILGETIMLRMQNRSAGERRLSIARITDNSIVAPTLSSLSTGQLALLSIFGTIIQYADVDNIDNSHRLHEIRGVVVIDEIELHLHAELQREVLPRLIKLFPSIQFIITSHSPLFLLGMKEEYGDDGFDIYEMPDARRISAEQFSQFESAYRYFKDTNKYKNEIRDAVRSRTEKTLIITEGATDWRHMKAAMAGLAVDQDWTWLTSADFEFLEYDPENSNTENPIKLKMSCSELISLCREYSKIKQIRKIICIADRDRPNDVPTLSGDQPYKDWGNNVYSLCLPIPEHRNETPLICIEHYYTDEEIKTEVDLGDGIIRRLYLGNEFDEHGRGFRNQKICSKLTFCGIDKINIIDGNDTAKVYSFDTEDKTNYALSKMDFAEKILRKEAPFDSVSFGGFKQLFTVIQEIVEKPLC